MFASWRVFFSFITLVSTRCQPSAVAEHVAHPLVRSPDCLRDCLQNLLFELHSCRILKLVHVMTLFSCKANITRRGLRRLLHCGKCGPQLGFALLQLFTQLGIHACQKICTRRSLNQLCQLFQVSGATDIYTYQIFLPVYPSRTGPWPWLGHLEQPGCTHPLS